ncbi:hypothetical protein TorRG33x02_284970 [Trema orientale]|uniref:Uncharacterized protein n=1 Tax=Trema orientale TaxID=63057 RepID=A0A2P5CH29_TREOI|nr:hypothetical protein TorRG33x02_284970 [Trema orientale]
MELGGMRRRDERDQPPASTGRYRAPVMESVQAYYKILSFTRERFNQPTMLSKLRSLPMGENVIKKLMEIGCEKVTRRRACTRSLLG